jgi:anti-anti-sigma factor
MILTVQKGKWLLLELEGRVDSSNSERLRSKIEAARAEGHRFFILDLQRTIFLGLPFIKFLTSLGVELRKAQGELALVRLSEKLKRQIYIFGTLDSIRIVRNVSELPETGADASWEAPAAQPPDNNLAN